MGEIWLGIEKKSITCAGWISECLNKVWFSLVCMNILAVSLEKSHDFLDSAW